jgi:hypothetical protein
MTTYGTPRESTALARIAALVPGADVIDPATRYRDSAHWRRDWPRLLRKLSAVVVFGARDGTVGAGCLHELADAWRVATLVLMLDDAGECRQLASLEVCDVSVRTSLRVAQLVPGRPVNLARAIGDLR